MFGNHSSQPSDTLNPRRKIYSSQMAEKGGQWNVASRLKRPWLGMKFRPNDAKFQWLLKNRENEVLTTTKTMARSFFFFRFSLNFLIKPCGILVNMPARQLQHKGIHRGDAWVPTTVLCRHLASPIWSTLVNHSTHLPPKNGLYMFILNHPSTCINCYKLV